MSNKAKNKGVRVRNFLLLTISGFINAFGVTMFLTPVGLYDGCISGTSMLLSRLTPLSLSVFLILLNVPLFLIGLKKQGKVFTIYSIYAVAMYSLGAWLIQDVLPVDVSMVSPFAKDDLLLCALFGGVISGVGSGLTIRYGGAIDGVEVMAVTFAKRLNLSVGTFTMLYNLVLYIICGFVAQDWILPLYSIVSYMAGSKTVDFIVEGLDRSKAINIITEKPNEVSEALMEEFGCGTTQIAAVGGYSGMNKTIIYFVINQFQISRVRTLVHEADPSAYMTISDVADVFKSITSAPMEEPNRQSDEEKKNENKDEKEEGSKPEVSVDAVDKPEYQK